MRMHGFGGFLKIFQTRLGMVVGKLAIWGFGLLLLVIVVGVLSLGVLLAIVQGQTEGNEEDRKVDVKENGSCGSMMGFDKEKEWTRPVQVYRNGAVQVKKYQEIDWDDDALDVGDTCILQ
jgi:hypothetical protein